MGDRLQGDVFMYGVRGYCPPLLVMSNIHGLAVTASPNHTQMLPKLLLSERLKRVLLVSVQPEQGVGTEGCKEPLEQRAEWGEGSLAGKGNANSSSLFPAASYTIPLLAKAALPDSKINMFCEYPYEKSPLSRGLLSPGCLQTPV